MNRLGTPTKPSVAGGGGNVVLMFDFLSAPTDQVKQRTLEIPLFAFLAYPMSRWPTTALPASLGGVALRVDDANSCVVTLCYYCYALYLLLLRDRERFHETLGAQVASTSTAVLAAAAAATTMSARAELDRQLKERLESLSATTPTAEVAMALDFLGLKAPFDDVADLRDLLLWLAPVLAQVKPDYLQYASFLDAVFGEAVDKNPKLAALVNSVFGHSGANDDRLLETFDAEFVMRLLKSKWARGDSAAAVDVELENAISRLSVAELKRYASNWMKNSVELSACESSVELERTKLLNAELRENNGALLENVDLSNLLSWFEERKHYKDILSSMYPLLFILIIRLMNFV
jgi:hypothetical protein